MDREKDLGKDQFIPVSYRKAARRVKRFLKTLNTAFRNAQLYEETHPMFEEGAKSFFVAISELLEEQGEGEIAFHFYEGEVIIDEVPFPEESTLFSSLIAELESREIGSIEIREGVKLGEVKDFLNIISLQADEILRGGVVSLLLQEKGVMNIKVAPVKPLSSLKESGEEKEEVYEIAREAYYFALETVEEVMSEVERKRPFAVFKARKAVQMLVDCVLQDRGALLGLAALKSYDKYTYHHSVNTLVLSLALGSVILTERVSLGYLGLSALLHDVGKVLVPREITQKPGPLTSEEWKYMERHPAYGAKILLNIPSLHKITSVVAFEHHLGFDGNGYPKIRAPRKPHLFSRIVEICDAYDAATSERPYRKAATPDGVMNSLIEASGREFDPLLMRFFINLLGVYPVGSLVKLTTGEIAVVVRENPLNLTRPQIKIFLDKEGNILKEPIFYDLSKNEEISISTSLPYEAVKKISYQKHLE